MSARITACTTQFYIKIVVLYKGNYLVMIGTFDVLSKPGKLGLY